MLEGLTELVGLSRLDTELAALDEERMGIPAKRAARDTERVAAEERLAAAAEAVQEAEQSQRRSETDAQDQEALLAKLAAQQNQVKTNAAYTALMSEMEHAREAISDAETKVLEAMEEIETARAALAAQEEQVRAIVERIEAENAIHQAREETLEKEIGALRERRGEQIAGLDVALLTRYEKIATRRRPAVSVVVAETCAGCRVGVPPQACIEILKGETLVTCGSCQRILIHEEQLRSAGS